MSVEDFSVMAKAILQDMESALEIVEENNNDLHKFQEYSDYAKELQNEAAKLDLKQVVSSKCHW